MFWSKNFDFLKFQNPFYLANNPFVNTSDTNLTPTDLKVLLNKQEHTDTLAADLIFDLLIDEGAINLTLDLIFESDVVTTCVRKTLQITEQHRISNCPNVRKRIYYDIRMLSGPNGMEYLLRQLSVDPGKKEHC